MSIRDLVPWGRSDVERPAASNETAHPVLTLHREMNRLFDDVFRSFEAPLWGGRGGGWPSIEVEETDQGYRVSAELPGLEEKDIEVSVQDGVLTLSGEKRSESEGRGRGVSERFYGRFERRIALGRDLDEANVKATFRNGVLTVDLPRSAEAAQRTRRIPVNVPSTSH